MSKTTNPLNIIRTRKAKEPVPHNNADFAWGMITGGLIVLLVFLALFADSTPAAASTENCDQYVAAASCNTLNPPALLPEAETPTNCVEVAMADRCSAMLAQTGNPWNTVGWSVGAALLLAGLVCMIIAGFRVLKADHPDRENTL